MPVNLDLKTSFDFPPKLTVGAYEKFQAVLGPAFEQYKSEQGTVTVIRYQAIHFRAATKAGLLRNWQSKLMPNLEPKDEDDVHVGVIEWAGQEIVNWIEAQKAVPKVSLWRLATQWIGKARLRQNS